jgi:hypothetical protein
VPQPAVAGGGERLHLQGRTGIVEAHRDDALAALLDLEPEVQVGTGQDLDATEIDVRADRVGLALIQGARGRAILWCRLRVLRDLADRLLVACGGVAHDVTPDPVALVLFELWGRRPVEPKPASPR